MAILEQLMRTAPLWMIGGVFFASLFAASWLGIALRRLLDRDRELDTSVDGYLLSATLALLGLLIAFTFSLALTRYDGRRLLIVAEANAISTAWLRATLIDGPEGQALQDSIRAYTDIRVKLPRTDDPAAVEAQSAQAQHLVWTRLRAALPRIEGPIGATLVNATTEMFDTAASRKAEREAQIPAHVLNVVSFFALMSAGIIGYVLGRRGELRHAVVSTLLYLLIALSMTLILDLDRPWTGRIATPMQSMIDARTAMD